MQYKIYQHIKAFLKRNNRRNNVAMVGLKQNQLWGELANATSYLGIRMKAKDSTTA